MSVGCVVLATLARLALEPAIGPMTPYITMFPAVLLASVIGGFGPGLLAILLSAATAQYIFVEPRFSFAPVSVTSVTSAFFYVLSAFLMVLTATAMRRAVERLETAQQKLLAALEASNTGTWRWDIKSDAVEWDPAMANVVGLGERLPPRNLEEFLALIHPRDRERVRRATAQAIVDRVPSEIEFRIVLPDGEERWIYDRGRGVHDGEGRPLYMVGACLNITERKRAEQRQNLLLHELNHRVKNTLATVQSLAVQTFRSSKNPADIQKDFMARLLALSATHNILTQTLWESASIRDILEAELSPYGGGGPEQERIRIEGEDVLLKPQQALSLGMAIHELSTNAAKHGALSTADGQTSISWHVEGAGQEGRQLVLRWSEQGGPSVDGPRSRGFGTRLIERSVVHELGGTMEVNFAPAGLEYLFKVPLTAS
ncbi:HWE histidine kinase domain-containing protein [Microvirga flocculans]|uniref:HWE histidine kinase domain-containing protein n=1 Tax=Microvirga flocculans TaxID=217168 RepID=UPI0004B36A40|nr:HWE histidine kinase domain-containing protein [Microvirga flocculans]